MIYSVSTTLLRKYDNNFRQFINFQTSHINKTIPIWKAFNDIQDAINQMHSNLTSLSVQIPKITIFRMCDNLSIIEKAIKAHTLKIATDSGQKDLDQASEIFLNTAINYISCFLIYVMLEKSVQHDESYKFTKIETPLNRIKSKEPTKTSTPLITLSRLFYCIIVCLLVIISIIGIIFSI